MSVHPDARCLGTIATDSVVGAFSTVGEGSAIGEGTTVGSHVTVGERVILGSQVDVADGSRIGAETVVEDQVVVGVGAVVAHRTRLGLNCVVRPGAVVNSDVPPNAIVEGNPARIVGYVDALRRSGEVINASAALADAGTPTVELGVGASAVWSLPRFEDLRGALVPADFESDLPFVPQRVFFVFDVPGEKVRGEHAHKACAQLLVAVHGALSVVVDDGERSQEVRLDRPSVGLLLPPRVWGIQYQFTEHAVLAVFASTPYDPDDYIRDYAGYLQFLAEGA
ncbi:MAG: WxcM-like domain-containing protein [Acidimicrobiia bacterium]|nr:WxcM-like domain-containing protein [Acidimicrobiia bacterium]